MLDPVLRGLTILLIVATALAVPLLAFAASGRRSVSVKGTLDAPFTVELADNWRIGVAGERMAFENYPHRRRVGLAVGCSPHLRLD